MTSDPLTTVAVPSITEPSLHTSQHAPSPMSSPELSPAASEDGNPARLQRPKLGSRKSSGTMIIPRDQPQVRTEMEYDDGDVRCMSPRRSSEEVEKLGDEARKDLVEQAKTLQASLMAIVDRVETVKSEHEKLEGGNKFLQSYIGELMQTSKITSTGPAKSKGKSKK